MPRPLSIRAIPGSAGDASWFGKCLHITVTVQNDSDDGEWEDHLRSALQHLKYFLSCAL